MCVLTVHVFLSCVHFLRVCQVTCGAYVCVSSLSVFTLYVFTCRLQAPAHMSQLDPADLLIDSVEDVDKPAIAIQVRHMSYLLV